MLKKEKRRSYYYGYAVIYYSLECSPYHEFQIHYLPKTNPIVTIARE